MLITPNTRTSPTFRTQVDAELTKKIYQRVPVLVNERTKESPWGITIRQGLFHLTNDRSIIADTITGEKPHDLKDFSPMIEAKLLHQFTHRWATYQGSDSRELAPDERADPHYTVTPRYWVERAEVEARLAGRWERAWLMGWRDVTDSRNERTLVASVFPRVGCNDKFLLMMPQDQGTLHIVCLLATFNSLTLDFVARQKVGGMALKYFTMKQLPVLPPEAFSAEDIAYIVPRVLELVYTAWDMQPFAADVIREGKRSGVMGDREDEPMTSDPSPITWPVAPYVWDEERRATVRAELDARIARLYGLTRDELRYILDPHDVYGADFPGETFRVLKEKETRQYGEYRTKRLVLAAWDAASEAGVIY